MMSKPIEDSLTIEELVDMLVQQSDDYDLNRRRTYRESLVCPVMIELASGVANYQAFSKNISRVGICLVSDQLVDPDQDALLEIKKPESFAARLNARCIWSQCLGEQYYLSGWRFI